MRYAVDAFQPSDLKLQFNKLEPDIMKNQNIQALEKKIDTVIDSCLHSV